MASISRRGEMRWGHNLPNGETVLLLLFSLGHFSCTDFFAFRRSVPLLHQDPYLPCLFCCLTFLFCSRVVLVLVRYLSFWSLMWRTSSSTYDSISNVQGIFRFAEVVLFRMCRVHRRVVFSHPHLFVTNAASSTIDARIS